MNALRAAVIAVLVLLPAICFWAVPLIAGLFLSPSTDSGSSVGGCRLPTRMTILGCSFAPNWTGVIVLVGVLIVYVTVILWWVQLAGNVDDSRSMIE